MSADTKWHLERRVPISIIAAILVQSLAAGWWAATLSGRVDSMERAQADARVTALRAWDRIRAADKKAAAIDTSVAAMAASMRNVERDVARIFAILDKRRKP